MYHCHINFFFLGKQRKIFKLIEEISPLEHFTHEYFESKTPYATMTSKADVIIANLYDMDAAATIQMLLSEKRPAGIVPRFWLTRNKLPVWQE